MPGLRLSLQSHENRAEHWFILTGVALVQIDTREITLTSGDSIDIPQRVKHRISALGDTPLSLIEIQTGTSFSEDDIVRYSDDFGRN